ncbi:hypothetical protein MASR1M60_29090 [Rhodocyclaceae bacterium]
MHANDQQQFLEKKLNFLKMRVEMIAWRVDELGMSPEIREALPESTLGVIESLLYETQPDPERLSLYEQTVCRTEETLAQNPSFWRSGNETLH